MFQSVFLEMEGIRPGTVRLTLLPAGVQQVGDSLQLQVGGLLHGVVVTNQNIPWKIGSKMAFNKKTCIITCKLHQSEAVCHLDLQLSWPDRWRTSPRTSKADSCELLLKEPFKYYYPSVVVSVIKFGYSLVHIERGDFTIGEILEELQWRLCCCQHSLEIFQT